VFNRERETRERHGGCGLELVGDGGGCGCGGLEVPLQIVGSFLSTKFWEPKTIKYQREVHKNRKGIK
jgi:hypothetical protein